MAYLAPVDLAQTLVYLEMVIRRFPLFKFKDNLDGNYDAWKVMLKYLGSSCLPNLQGSGLRGSWMNEEHRHVDQIQDSEDLRSMLPRKFRPCIYLSFRLGR